HARRPGGERRPDRRGLRGAAAPLRDLGDRRKSEPQEMIEPVPGPAADRREAMRRSIRALLGPAGAAAALFPGYEARPGQLAMAERIADAIDGDERLMVEAGTGTG